MFRAAQSVVSLKRIVALGRENPADFEISGTAVLSARQMAQRLEAKHGVVISNGKPKDQYRRVFIHPENPQKKAQPFPRKAAK